MFSRLPNYSTLIDTVVSPHTTLMHKIKASLMIGVVALMTVCQLMTFSMLHPQEA
jgi:hypothetical protein